MTGEDKGSSHSRARRVRPYVPAVLTLCVGIAVSVSSFAVARNWERERLEAEFHRYAEDRVSALRRGLEFSLYEVESLGGLYAASVSVEPHEFREFAVRHLAHAPGTQAMEWIPRVPRAERERYEEAARLWEFEDAAKREAFAKFEITERETQGKMIRAGERDEYYPVYYVEPYEGNEAAVGFDLASNPTRLVTLNRSGDTGDMLATARIILVQETRDQYGFLVFLPVYRKGASTDSVQDRRDNLLGFVLGVFRVGDIFEKALTYLEPAGTDLQLVDQSAPEGECFLYHHYARTREAPAGPVPMLADLRAGLHHEVTLEVAGRQWLIVCAPTPRFLAARRTWYPWGVLAAGLVLTGLLTSYLVSSIGRARRTERLVAALSKANEQLKTEIAERKQAQEVAARAAIDWQHTFDAINDMVFIIDRDYRVLRANRTMQEVFAGRSVVGDLFYEIVHGTGCPPPNCPVPNVLLSGEVVHTELCEEHLDGRWFDILGCPIRDETGTVARMVHVIRDITVRKRAEEHLKALNTELQRSNRDLQDFTHAVSHDLQEPLRKIHTFGQFLVEDFGDRLPQEGREHLRRVQDAAVRMKGLIRHLLALAMVGSKGWELVPVQPRELIDRALEDVSEKVRESGAEVTIEEGLPMVMADALQLGQVFQNLIGNALKFRLPERQPKIAVSGRVEKDHAIFSVTDNGIGIQESSLEKIFGVFQRLHPREEYEGVGVGLALCKKIIQRHGGTIWAESQVGKGSTFRFTLSTVPVKEEEKP